MNIPAILFVVLFSLTAIGQRPSREVRKLVRELPSHYLRIHYAFYRTDTLRPFPRLCKTATTEELLLLTAHRKPAVKGYAALALAQLNYPGIAHVMEAFIESNEVVEVRDACTRTRYPIYLALYFLVRKEQFYGKNAEQFTHMLQRFDSVFVSRQLSVP